MDPEYDHFFKLLLIGNSFVGKSRLLERYAGGVYTDIATIGIDFKTRDLNCFGKRIKLQIWDTSGHEMFRTVTSSYYRGVHGILLLYDISHEKTFNQVESVWLSDIDRYNVRESVPKLLVGMKADLDARGKREVSYERAEVFAENLGMDFIEVSAQENINVEECFEMIVMRILSDDDKFGRTPLHIASEIGQKDNVSRLLAKKKPGLEVRDSLGRIPLHIGCEKGFKDVVSLLLAKKKANLEARDPNGRTPLHIACENGHQDIVFLLMSNNANLEARDSERKTPLHLVCGKGHEDIVFLLLAKNANLEARDSNGKTPLHIACEKGNKDIVSLLLSHNANLEVRDFNQRTPLYIASENTRQDVVALLWTNNISFESREMDQKKTIDFGQLLEQACQQGKIDVVERILSLYSNDVNIQFDWLKQKTPLHVAAESGDKRIILLLLRNNASLEIMDKDGVKPKDLKIVQECIEMENQYGSLKKFSEEIDKRPNKILNRYHQIQLHLKVPKKTLSQSQPPPSFRSALTSLVHTQKRLPQPTIGLPLLNENDVEEIIGVCEAFLAHKTQASSQFQQVMSLVTHDEALAIVCYCWEMPYFIPFRFHEWFLRLPECDEREGKERREGMEGMGGYLELLEGGLRKLSKNLKTNVKVEGMDEEVGCIWLGELLFDLKEQEGIVFPFSSYFYQRTRTWKLIKTDDGYIPSTPLHLSSPSSSAPSSFLPS